MTTTEIIQKYGVDHYYDDAGTHYIVVDKSVSRTDAMRAANKFFKVNSLKLAIYDGYIVGDTLYFQKKLKGKKVWAVEVIK